MSEEEYDDEPLPIEEKLAICQYFISDCPPGHVADVVSALKTLDCADVLTDDVVAGMLSEYHAKNGTVVPVAGSDFRLCVSSEGKVGENSYLETAGGHVVEFNAMTGEAGQKREATAAELGSGDSDMQSEIQDAVNDHVKKNYSANSAAVVTSTGNTFTVVIGSEKQKLEAFWSGRWLSKWKVEVTGGGKAAVSGNLRLLAHYFEEGNVQMNLNRDSEQKEISFSDAGGLASSVAKYIEATSATLHDEIDNMFDNMQQTTFKAIRRTLPINGSKFQWQNYQMYKLAGSRQSTQ